MAIAAVMKALKALNRRALTDFNPQEHARHLKGEGDRAYIILHSASIEALILNRLEEAMPGLNADERQAMFNFEGPAGSFSSRLKLAQGLGIIDRPTRKAFDLIREMRNVAAHSHAPITFDTEEIRQAAIALFPSDLAAQIKDWHGRDLREVFGLLVVTRGAETLGVPTPFTLAQLIEGLARARNARDAQADKSA